MPISENSIILAGGVSAVALAAVCFDYYRDHPVTALLVLGISLVGYAIVAVVLVVADIVLKKRDRRKKTAYP
ncbi:hypothetical protein [Rhodococcus erythropolis]|uniref:hypothetical protein n=1 Tax=Rhodococcus erythropolis TaxID=1833 RepID=UPI001BE84070|nr:hypothetical protein [Rhodococcus erythropolis]MBT2269067.1 hypothetical protein [Rhodococcus erythropolis]